jgi:U3 small nucleolar RNA-associated protein 23
MRARRSKKYRKIMSAYQMGFSFREPYQVLLDSHFLKTAHSFHMPLQKYLDNTLHGKCNLFVTKCTLQKVMDAHLKKRKENDKQKEAATGETTRGQRGPGRPEFLPPPTELPLRHCKHKDDEGQELGVVSEARCLLDLLAGQPHGNEHAKNKQHYILATADADEREARSKGFIDVRERARMIPGVPIVYVKRSVMILEELSGASERTLRKAEKDKFGEGLVGLSDRKRKRGQDDDGDEADGDELLPTDERYDGPKIRGLKRAKGPNPLSVKKKKVKSREAEGNSGDALAGRADAPRKKPTRRAGKRGAMRKEHANVRASSAEARAAGEAAIAQVETDV